MKLMQVDVFTDRPFFGNPVAVVIGAEGLDAATMRQLGRDGRVTVRVSGKGIEIGGRCVTCAEGTLRT